MLEKLTAGQDRLRAKEGHSWQQRGPRNLQPSQLQKRLSSTHDYKSCLYLGDLQTCFFCPEILCKGKLDKEAFCMEQMGLAPDGADGGSPSPQPHTFRVCVPTRG